MDDTFFFVTTLYFGVEGTLGIGTELVAFSDDHTVTLGIALGIELSVS